MYSKGINNAFTGIEMFKFAILMEEESYNSYIHAANYTTGKTKEFCTFAARQELIHKKNFERLSIELKTNLKIQTDYIFDKEISTYLKDLIKNRVFNKKEQTNDEFKDLKEALAHSIKYEKIAINVYTQMYERVFQNEDRKSVV